MILALQTKRARPMTNLLEVNEGAFRASCISGDFRLQESGSLRLSTLLPRVERVKQKNGATCVILL